MPAHAPGIMEPAGINRRPHSKDQAMTNERFNQYRAAVLTMPALTRHAEKSAPFDFTTSEVQRYLATLAGGSTKEAQLLFEWARHSGCIVYDLQHRTWQGARTLHCRTIRRPTVPNVAQGYQRLRTVGGTRPKGIFSPIYP